MKSTVLCLLVAMILSQDGWSQTDLRGTLFHDCIEREYALHLPHGYDSNSLYPMILLLHGFVQTGADIQAYSEINFLADQEDFIVLAPDGIEGETPWGINTHWNAGFNDEVDDLGFLDRLLDAIAHQYAVDLRRIYAVGFSNGGFMSFRLACELSERIAGIASVSGSMSRTQWKTCHPVRSIPILDIYGTADRTIDSKGDSDYLSTKRLLSFWTDHNDVNEKEEVLLPDLDPDDQTRVVLTRYFHPDHPDVEIRSYKIEEGGHTWPGAADFPLRGNTSHDIKATEVIWDFLQQYWHPNPRALSIPSPSMPSICATPSAMWNIQNQYLNVNWTDGLAHWVRLRDMQGRTIGESIDPRSHWQLNVSGHSAGLYILSFKQQGLMFHRKIILR